MNRCYLTLSVNAKLLPGLNFTDNIACFPTTPNNTSQHLIYFIPKKMNFPSKSEPFMTVTVEFALGNYFDFLYEAM